MRWVRFCLGATAPVVLAVSCLSPLPEAEPPPSDDAGSDASDAAEAGCETKLDTPTSCGACNHSCLGQPCNAGKCTPVTLVESTTQVWEIAVDSERLYYTEWLGSVESVSKADGSAPLTLASNLSGAWFFALDGSELYVSTRTFGQLFRVQTDGSGSESMLDVEFKIQGVTVGATDVYYGYAEIISAGLSANGAVARIAKTATGAASVTDVYPDLEEPWSITASADKLFWTQRGNGEVIRAPQVENLGPIETLATVQGELFGIAENEGSVWWTTADSNTGPGRLLRRRTSDSAPVIVWNGGAPGFLKTDATHAYWVVTGPPSSVLRLSLDAEPNTAPDVLYTGDFALRGIAVDDTWVYFAGSEGGAILKVPK